MLKMAFTYSLKNIYMSEGFAAKAGVVTAHLVSKKKSLLIKNLPEQTACHCSKSA